MTVQRRSLGHLMLKMWAFAIFAMCTLNQAHAQIAATATASTSLQDALLAVDGNQVSRWESFHGVDPSTLTLDLGGTFALTDVVIYWEAANANTYTVQGSNDNSQCGPLWPVFLAETLVTVPTATS
jgi:hypothetical protein